MQHSKEWYELALTALRADGLAARTRVRELERLAQDLVDAVKGATDPAPVSNDLGNAMDAMEKALRKERDES